MCCYSLTPPSSGVDVITGQEGRGPGYEEWGLGRLRVEEGREIDRGGRAEDKV